MFAPIALVFTRIAILLGFHRETSLFTETESIEIVDAIAQAEEKTSAEIRVHISHKFKGDDIVAAAAKTFAKLGMDKTVERNGILIFLVPNSKQFAIFGDAGINAKMQVGDWDEIRNHMQQLFREQQFKAGIVRGIREIGQILATHFPPTDTNPNELSNQISTDA